MDENVQKRKKTGENAENGRKRLESVENEHDKLVGSYDLDPILRSRSCKDKNDPRWDRDLDSLAIPAHGVSEAHNGSPHSILSHEPKPLGKHRPPPPQ
ncbi:hypothetical protein Tco_1218200 [Tanacetum coccineum]